jgi:hypothetical protein
VRHAGTLHREICPAMTFVARNRDSFLIDVRHRSSPIIETRERAMMQFAPTTNVEFA